MSDVIDTIDETVPKQPPPEFEATSASELQDKEFPPILWCVAGMICMGLCLIVGAPKIGKSWIVLSLALAVSCGEEIFGFVVNPCGVAYFALEDSRRRLQARIRVLGLKEWPDNLQFITELPVFEEPEELIEAVRLFIKENPDVRFLIFDTLQRIRGCSGSGNAYELDSAFLTPFHKIAHELDICILLVHHTRKSDSDDPYEKISGSQGLMGIADTVMMLEAKTRGKADRILRITGRDVEEKDYAMSFERGIWAMLGDAAQVTMSNERRKVLECVRDADKPVGPAKVAELTGLNHGSVKNMLPILVKDGFLEKEARGKYTTPTGCLLPGAVETDDLMTSEED